MHNLEHPVEATIQAYKAVPHFFGAPRKNDALFMFGATQPFPFVYTYVQENTEIILGPSCKAEKEIKLDACTADGIVISYRRSGGGTVVLASGMIVTIVVSDRELGDTIEETHARIHRGLISIIDPYLDNSLILRGISDIAIQDKKILGSSLYLSQKPSNYYYQSVLMVDSDLDLLEKYLLHPPKEPAYRQGRPHKYFCTTLRNEGLLLSAPELSSLIRNALPSLLQRRFISPNIF